MPTFTDLNKVRTLLVRGIASLNLHVSLAALKFITALEFLNVTVSRLCKMFLTLRKVLRFECAKKNHGFNLFYRFFFMIHTYYVISGVICALFLGQNFKIKVLTMQKKITFWMSEQHQCQDGTAGKKIVIVCVWLLVTTIKNSCKEFEISFLCITSFPTWQVWSLFCFDYV